MLSWDKIYKRGIQSKWGQEKLQEDMPKLLKIFKKTKVEKILDLGCGSGRHVVFFAKNGFEVWGIDYSKIGIRRTKEKLKAIKANAHLRVGDVFRKLPYPNNFFDVIICVQVINHNKLHVIRKAFKEMERTLKSGGFLYISGLRKWWMKNKEDYKKIGKRTYMPIAHEEVGVIHYTFTKIVLQKLLKNYKTLSMRMNKPKFHWLVLAKKL